MDREKINKYFLNLIDDIIENESEWSSEALLCESGLQYQTNDYFLAEVEFEICYEFNIKIEYGASKLVMIFDYDDEYSNEYVVKIPFGYTTMDYCEEEVKTYNSVLYEFEDFKDYFAECWRAGTVEVKDRDGFLNHIPVYIMRRADVNKNKVSSSSYEFWINDGGKPEYYNPEEDEEIINCFKNYYGKSLGEDIEEVIDTLEINDLHDGNVGFIEDRPILIDYSGFWG